jgi:hypothetical protein
MYEAGSSAEREVGGMNHEFGFQSGPLHFATDISSERHHWVPTTV